MARAHSPLIKLAEVGSTNSWLVSQPGAEHGTAVYAVAQTAGRGQRGNTWEAEPGKNISMSLLLRPRHIEPRRQQVISEVVALATARLVASLLPDHTVSIKWPNDIYVGAKKIAGILIEHTLSGCGIDRTVVGIGLNVNQEAFLSDAPNPVSLWQLAGQKYSVDELTGELVDGILTLFDEVDVAEADTAALHSDYRSMLWRLGIPAQYRDTASGELFEATIADVEPTGHLHLTLSDGSTRRYAFKEVAFIL